MTNSSRTWAAQPSPERMEAEVFAVEEGGRGRIGESSPEPDRKPHLRTTPCSQVQERVGNNRIEWN